MVIKCLCFDGVKNSENCTFRFRKLYVSFLRLYICTDTKIYQLNVIYVSIFFILFMLLITFLSSKIQCKKSFVKCIRRKAGCSCDSVDFIYKSYPQPPISLQM